MQAGLGGRQGQGLCSRGTRVAAGKGSGHASVPQQLPAAALHACSARPARAPGPLQEAITLGRQENPPPRLLPCSHAPALQPCQLLAQGDFFFFQAVALVAQAHLTSGLWHPVKAQGQELPQGGFLALAPCWHHHCQQPPQQQESDGASQGRWHFAGILWAAAVLGSKGREMRSHCCPTGRLTLSSL